FVDVVARILLSGENAAKSGVIWLSSLNSFTSCPVLAFHSPMRGRPPPKNNHLPSGENTTDLAPCGLSLRLIPFLPVVTSSNLTPFEPATAKLAPSGENAEVGRFSGMVLSSRIWIKSHSLRES